MEPKVTFFLGANTPSGFYSLYDQMLPPQEARRIYLLKGGAGCGKSSLMKRVAAALEEAGESVEYIRCSGDPDSLDAVIFPRLKAAIVDATAPHVMEPRLPGVVESYVDLGRFYDHRALAKQREEVAAATDGYKSHYKRAYRCLTAAAQLAEDNRALLLSPSLEAKTLKRARGILSREVKKRAISPVRPSSGSWGPSPARGCPAGLTRWTPCAARYMNFPTPTVWERGCSPPWPPAPCPPAMT